MGQEPTGRGMNTTAKGRISPREYSEYLPPVRRHMLTAAAMLIFVVQTDKGGQSKIDLVNMEKEFFKDANAASLEFAREVLSRSAPCCLPTLLHHQLLQRSSQCTNSLCLAELCG